MNGSNNSDSEIPVVDRRRFDSEGQRREEAPELASDNGAAAPSTPPAPSPELEEWRRRAEAAEGKLREVADQFVRARADMEAARQRLVRDQETRVQDGVGRAFLGVLAALDNLERALDHAEEGPLLDGLRMAQRQILDAMAGEGLEKMSLVGSPFDPALAEGMIVTPVDDPAQDNLVLEELRPGYTLSGRIVRPAQVRVARLNQ